MNSTIRKFKIKLLKNKNYLQQQLKQTNSNCKIHKQINKNLKTNKGPRSPTLA